MANRERKSERRPSGMTDYHVTCSVKWVECEVVYTQLGAINSPQESILNTSRLFGLLRYQLYQNSSPIKTLPLKPAFLMLTFSQTENNWKGTEHRIEDRRRTPILIKMIKREICMSTWTLLEFIASLFLSVIKTTQVMTGAVRASSRYLSPLHFNIKHCEIGLEALSKRVPRSPLPLWLF